MILVSVNLGESFKFSLEVLNYVVLGIVLMLFLCFSWFYFVFFINTFRKEKPIEIKSPKNKFAVLIPARNESKVIKNILNSLYLQDYPKKLYEIFVIVEDKNDPTVKITKEFGSHFHVIVRKNLENRHTKGYALDDAISYIKNHKKSYDAYLIFDADNVVSKNYLSVMNSIKEEGYQIGLGYRNYTNATFNWVSLTCSLLFSFINSFTNKGRSDLFNKVSLTGTGYFIDSKIIDEIGGWKFVGMTEDVELTDFAYKNNIKMKSYPLVSYYDEQPISFKVMHNQHIRWVWGFFLNKNCKIKNLKYVKKSTFKDKFAKIEHKFCIYPFISFIILEFLVFIVDYLFGFISLGMKLDSTVVNNAFIYGSYHLFIIFSSVMLIALMTICIDNHNLKFNLKNILKALLFYPIFFMDFALAFFDGLFHKEKRTNWKPILHNGKILEKDALIIKEEDQNEIKNILL